MSRLSTSRTVGAIPDWPEDVGQVFRNHHSYYQDKVGEVAHQQQTGETQIRREYSGRVVFELLQNALDRAVSTVNVSLLETGRETGEYVLVVTNDGEGIRVDPEYQYDHPPDAGEHKSGRPDFNALCSVATSNKSPDESIGTKGIGFRSVFSLGTHVRVWSRFSESSSWWGLEMHSPFTRATWEARRDEPAIQNGREKFLDGELPLEDGERRPSYHFPLPLYSDTYPIAIKKRDDVSTEVVVPVTEEHTASVRDQILEFQSKHLYFVGLDEDNRDITVYFETPNEGESFQRKTWPSPETPHEAPWVITDHASPALAQLAHKAEHDVAEPRAAIAFPPAEVINRREQGESAAGTIYGYLPTLIDAPFFVDVQGDFQLSIDRTNIRFDDDQMGPYNTQLLTVAAELHLLQFIRMVDETLVNDVEWDRIQPDQINHADWAGSPHCRDDLWRFLDPSVGDSPAATRIINHVEQLLFSGGSQDTHTYEIWGQLADRYFKAKDEWPVETYDLFWAASTAWLDRLCSTKSRRTNWRRTALAMCDALRSQEAPVAPVVFESDPDNGQDVPAVPLPERDESPDSYVGNQRHERKLFLHNGDKTDLTLPTAMREEGRAVTAFDFASDLYSGSPNALGTTDFNRWEVLHEIRQLPNSLKRWSPTSLAPNPTQAIEYQHELLSFAADLYLLDTETSYVTPQELSADGPGWRALEKPSNAARRAGRSVATLFLPTTDGGWLPARQLTRDNLDKDRLGELPESLPLDEFLTFLGVAPEPPEAGKPLTVVEGGDRGESVDPMDVPPSLTPAGPGVMDLTLGELPPEDTCAEANAWYISLEAAGDWLYPLLETEQLATDPEADGDHYERIDLVGPLGKRPWYPVDQEGDSLGASSPSWANEATTIAPQNLTLLTAQQRYLAEILWSVDRNTAPERLLTILGAVNGTAREDLATNGAEPAFRLLKQLQQPDPNTFDDRPRVQTEFVQLFERVLEAIVRGDSDPREGQLAVLTYESDDEPRALADRRLDWTDVDSSGDPEAWIAGTDTDQEGMRRLFYTEPLVAAIIGPEVLAGYPPLAEHSISIDVTVRSEPLADPESATVEHAEDIADTLSPTIPKLLALAGADQHITVSLTDQVERWGPELFKPVANVWREFTAQLDSETVRTEYKDNDDTALLYTETGTEPDETSVIKFDISEEGEPPSLDAFGRPLAELLLVENRSEAASLFERALQAYESAEDNLDRLLERRGAVPLVRSYEQRIDPLDSDAKADLLERTDQVLNEFGLELNTSSLTRLGALRPRDITVTESNRIRAEDVNSRFAKLSLSEKQEPFRPKLMCESVNRRRWEEWFDTHRSQLVPFLLDLLRPEVIEDLEPDSLVDRLDEHMRTQECGRIEFHPEEGIRNWLRVEGLDASQCPDDLLADARRFVPSYDQVTEVNKASDSGWEPHSPSKDDVNGGDEAGTVDQEEVIETMREQKAVGTHAERAALKMVTEQTHEVIEQTSAQDTIETVDGTVESPWEVLHWPIPQGGVTARNLETAQKQYEEGGGLEALEQGLHISDVWDGAGFDLLGLERVGGDDNRLQPIRYEIKAISSVSSTVGLHLTDKQLSVHDTVHDASIESRRHAGDWQLWGVERGGNAFDFTDELRRLPTHALEELIDAGFDHDGLILKVRRPKKSLSET